MKLEYRSFVEMLLRRKRLIVYLLSFVGIVLLQTWLYSWGMARFEDAPRTLQDSFGVVIQSITTTGYGQDAPWESTFMSALVVFMQFTGIAYVYLALPLFVVPWIEDIIVEPRVPDRLDTISDHVVVGGAPQFYSALVDDLAHRGHPYLIVEGDSDRAKDLYRDDENVIEGDLATEETLENANVDDARAVVADVTEVDGIGSTLSVRNFDEEVNVTCIIEDPTDSQYLRYAGATSVLSPKHRLGKSLADKAQHRFRTEVQETGDADADFDIAEFPITSDSNVIGREFTEFETLTAPNASLVGAWIRGEFVTEFREGDRIDRNTSLVVAGTEAQLAALAERIDVEQRRPTEGPVVIAGHGIVGSTADAILQKADCETTSIDAEKRDAVDVVGDATSASTFDKAGIEDAATVVVCLSDDSAALKATLVAATMNPDAEVVVAAEDVTNTNKLYRAGADYVVTLPDVAARMTTLDIFEEDVMQLCNRVELSTVDADGFDDTSSGVEAWHRDGVSVVGVRRNGDVLTGVDPDFDVRAGDEVVVAGTSEAIEECAVGFSEAHEE